VRFRRVVPSIVAPAIVLAGLAGVAAFQTSPAQATAVTGLPITSVYQVVADTAHGHLFISQGPDAGTNAPVVVTNLSGTPITTIGDGARGLALSANDETLYAATGDTVSAFSTTTLKETGSYPTPGTAWQVALQSGRLWVSYQDDSSGKVGAIDLADPSTPWDSVPGQWIEWPPVIAVDPSDKGVLVTSSVGTNEPVTASYNVSDPSAVTLINSATSTGCGNNGLSVLPGGKTFLCDGYPYSTATLAPQDPSGTYATGFTAVAPDGAIAAGIGGSANGVVWAYPAGSTTPTASYEGWDRLPLPSSFVVSASAPVDFAWSASSQQLFTIIESWSNDSDSNPVYTLLSLYPFEKVPADLTLTSTATTVQYGASATITAHLGYTYGPPNFSFYETPAGQPRQLLWSGEIEPYNTITSAGSSFTRNTTFTATYGGDPRYDAATVNLAIKVGVKLADSLSGYYKTTTVAGLNYHLYHRNATLKDLVTVTPSKPGECVRFEVQKSVNGVWHPNTISGCAALNKWSQTMRTSKLSSTGWYRFRPDFTASAKDTTNVSTDGGWLYYVIPT
jgi:hypothetical protein